MPTGIYIRTTSNAKGKHWSLNSRLKRRESGNPTWKGDKVKYRGLHSWVFRNWGKADICEICNSTRCVDWHNMDGKYKRGREDWKKVCRKCHMKIDGRSTSSRMNPQRLKKSIKKKCDIAFSLSVRKYGKCQFAGLDNVRCGGGLQTAHIEGRGALRLRFDQQNALCICAGHHVFYTYHPTAFNELVAEFFPSQWKYVQEHKHERLNMTYQDYEELLKTLK